MTDRGVRVQHLFAMQGEVRPPPILTTPVVGMGTAFLLHARPAFRQPVFGFLVTAILDKGEKLGIGDRPAR